MFHILNRQSTLLWKALSVFLNILYHIFVIKTRKMHLKSKTFSSVTLIILDFSQEFWFDIQFVHVKFIFQHQPMA